MSSRLIFVVLAFQVIAFGLYAYQFVTSVFGLGRFEVSWAVFEIIEVTSVTGLFAGTLVTLAIVLRLKDRNARVEEQLAIASDSFQAILTDKFSEWKLTTAEREVALLIVKGFSVSEIAALRGKKEGTIKAHNSAIYAKSGLSGRVQLVSYFLEELTAPIDDA